MAHIIESLYPDTFVTYYPKNLSFFNYPLILITTHPPFDLSSTSSVPIFMFFLRPFLSLIYNVFFFYLPGLLWKIKALSSLLFSSRNLSKCVYPLLSPNVVREYICMIHLSTSLIVPVLRVAICSCLCLFSFFVITLFSPVNILLTLSLPYCFI